MTNHTDRTKSRHNAHRRKAARRGRNDRGKGRAWAAGSRKKTKQRGGKKDKYESFSKVGKQQMS